MLTKVKEKKCKVCGEKYSPANSMQKVCNYKCAIELSKKEEKKKFKAQTRQMKKELNQNDRKYCLKKLQTTFNSYIRKRDAGRSCISCGRIHTGQNHAGHYLSVGAHPELRFHPLNCHLQCAPCNNHLSGNIVEYRKGLIEKIGIEMVEWLEGPHELQKLTLEEIKAANEFFKQLTKDDKSGFDNFMEGLHDL